MKSYFSLKDPKGTEPTPIIFFVVCADKRLKFGTGEKVHPKDFEDGELILKNNRRVLGEIDARLADFKTKADKFARNCDFENRPVLAEELREYLKPGRVKGSNDPDMNLQFFTDYQQIIDMATTGALLTEKTKNRYSKGLMRAWKLNRHNLQKFLDQNARPDITVAPDRMSIETVTAFRAWMMEKDQSKNYIGAQVKMWRRVLELMLEQGMHKNAGILRHKLFRPEKENVYKVFLTEEDIEKIYSFSRPGHWLEEVRDRWLVMYCTGIRVSDSQRLRVSHIQKDNIVLINKKTGKRIVAPKHEILIEILETYGGLPKPISEQLMNEHIKLIAKEVGLDQTITYKMTKGGVEKEFSEPKWSLITNHTARRSLVSNMIANGIDYQIGGSIVGMAPETWSLYNKLRNEEKVTVIAANPVFKKPVRKKQKAS